MPQDALVDHTVGDGSPAADVRQPQRDAVAVAQIGALGRVQACAETDLDGGIEGKQCDMSQEDFASAFGFTTAQIRDWEQKRSRPLGGARAYLMIIETDPVGVLAMLRQTAARKRAAA